MDPADDNQPATRGELRALRGEMNQRFEKIDERFEKVDERFEKIDERFDKMDERFDKMDERFDKMDAKFDTFAEMFGKLRVELLEDGARRANAILEEVRSHFRASSDRESDLEARLDAHVADASVHVSAAPARGGRASRTRRRR